MFSKLNPPKYVNHMAAAQVTRQLYDFGRDKEGKLIIVKSGKQCFDEMAAAAAAGCDFKAIHQALRSGSVRLSKDVFEQTPGKGEIYGDATQDPHSLIEADNIVKQKAAAVMESFAKLPEDLRAGMTVSQYLKFVENGGLQGYVKSHEPKQEVKEDAKQ